jgi:two-component system response regulator LytT
MKVLILEDESLAAEKIETCLREIDPAIQVVAKIKSVESGVDWLSKNEHPDLILSDIRLLDGLSFEIFDKVKVDKPVIFTTAYDQYAIRAFEVNSIDYLLKPVQLEKLRISLEKFRGMAKNQPVDFNEVLRQLRSAQPQYKSRFMVKLGQKIIAIPAEKIAYFFSENKLSFILTRDGKKYPTDQPLDELEDLLDPDRFFRANRQFIITFESISEIHPYFKGRIKLHLLPTTEEEVVISSERTPEFKKWIDK